MKKFLAFLVVPLLFIAFKTTTFAFEANSKSSSDLSDSYVNESKTKFTSFVVKFKLKTNVKKVNFEYSVSDDSKSWSNWEKASTKNELHEGEVKQGLSKKDRDNTLKDDETDFTGITSENISVKNSSKYIRIKISDKSKVDSYTVHFLYDDGTKPIIPNAITPLSYNFNYLGLNIVTRNAWGCPDQDTNSPYNCNNPFWEADYAPTTHLIVHHTVTKNNATDWAAEVRNIWYYHSHINDSDPNDGVQGWTDIGYNFLIDPNGVIYEGRFGGEGTSGGHVYSHNRGTVGIAMLGTYSNQNVTNAARNSLINLTISLSSRYRFNAFEMATDYYGYPMMRISGHNQWVNGATECPGNTLFTSMPNLRAPIEYASSVKTFIAPKQDLCPTEYTTIGNTCNTFDVGDTPGNYPSIQAVTYDDNGNLFYTTNSPYQVVREDVNGIRTTYPLPNLGSNPRAIVYKNNFLYIVNDSTNNVLKVDLNGNGSILGSTGNNPVALVVDNSGNVYTANYFDHTVTKITPSGVSSKFADTGYNPLDITIDPSGNIYTANSYSNSITKITSTGAATHFRIPGENPKSIISDSLGNIFVTSYGTHEILKFANNQFSRLAITDKYPEAITMDPSGNLYTTHSSTKNISKITPNGNLKVIPTQGVAFDITAKSGRVVTSNPSINDVTIVNIHTNSIPQTIAVHRFWSSTSQSHFFTSSVNDRDGMMVMNPPDKWVYEGVAFYAYSSQVTPSMKPVYRFWSPIFTSHFYTIDPNEKAYIEANLSQYWKYERIEFYAYPSQVSPSLSPIYRFWSPAMQSHFYTINELEKNYIIQKYPSNIWTYEKSVFFGYV